MSRQKKPAYIKLRERFNIKPFYTTAELKTIIGYKTHEGATRFLEKLHIPKNLVGKVNIWYLSDIQTYAPELFSSILECANLLALRKEVEDEFMLTDDYK